MWSVSSHCNLRFVNPAYRQAGFVAKNMNPNYSTKND